jgi:ribosomal protein L36
MQAWTGKKLAGDLLEKIRVIAQDVLPSDIDPKKLTNDCYIVVRRDGVIDVIKARRMVDIFDHYYDLGILLKSIDFSGGRRNPKLQEPEV